MSTDKLSVVEQFTDGISRQDWPTCMAVMSEDCEIHDHDIPDAGVYRGPEGFLDWITQWGEAWDGWDVEDIQMRSGPGDTVLVEFELKTTGLSSGIESRRSDLAVETVRDGKLCRLEYYNQGQKAAALEAIGAT